MVQDRGTYIIVRSLDYDPDSIRLGDIFTKPTNPQSRIGRLELKTPPRVSVEDFKVEASGSGNAGLWPVFLKETGKGYTADAIETWLPDQWELDKGLNRSETLQVLNRLPERKKRVYVVAGVIVAKGLKISSETSPSEVHSGIMVPPSAVEIGTEISKSPHFESGDIVFAYRLRVLEQRKSLFGKKTIRSGEFSSSGAFL